MSTEIGRRAEKAAAQFLQTQGYVIIEQNWRTRWCEIDLVAKRGETVHFVEVKYRSNPAFGHGIDYITPRKLQQMYFAAEFWLSQQKQDIACCLGSIELSGDPPKVTQWIADVG